MRTSTRHRLTILALCLPTVAAIAAPIDLLEVGKEKLGWAFHEGREFPGARGGIEVVQGQGDRPELKITGDFSEGGQYVAARTAAISGHDPDTIDISFRAPGAERIVLRIVDGAERTHQFTITIGKSAGDQAISFNLPAFFANENPGVRIAQYEAWGGGGPRSGRENAQWTAPAKALTIVLNKRPDQPSRELNITKASVTTKQ